LASKAIQTRVKKVQDFVYHFSSAYNIPPPLVFAIIHTE
jgi:soluble lytic murein transglycosylase-like protein